MTRAKRKSSERRWSGWATVQTLIAASWKGLGSSPASPTWRTSCFGPPAKPTYQASSSSRATRSHGVRSGTSTRGTAARWINNSAASSGACRSATADISGPSSRRSIYPGCLGLYDSSWITLSPDELERFYSSARKPFEVLAMRVVVARGIPLDCLDERLPAQLRPAIGGEELLVRYRLERRQQPRERLVERPPRELRWIVQVVAVGPLVDRVGGVRGIASVICLAARSEAFDHEHAVVVPPSHVGEQILAGPVVHRRLEQPLVGEVLDRVSHALVCLPHCAHQLRLVQRARMVSLLALNLLLRFGRGPGL